MSGTSPQAELYHQYGPVLLDYGGHETYSLRWGEYNTGFMCLGVRGSRIVVAQIC